MIWGLIEDGTRRPWPLSLWISQLVILILIGCAAHPEYGAQIRHSMSASCYGDLEQGVAALSNEIFGALDKEHQDETFLISGTERTPLMVLKLMEQELTAKGLHFTVSGELLALTYDAQSLFQLGPYQKERRASLKPADVLVALDRSISEDGNVEIRASLIRLKDDDSGFAGEMIPGSYKKVCVEVQGRIVQAMGEGFCNKRLPRERWRYSAIKAATLAAKTKLLEMIEGIYFEKSTTSNFQELTQDEVKAKAQGSMKDVKIVAKHFDPLMCKGAVTVEAIVPR